MARNGKIARLPRAIRQELNQRLQDGETGPQLVEWLNALPEVLEILKARFSGRPISEQNLSEWRQGGYEDWLRHEEGLDWIRMMADEAVELEEEAQGTSIAERLAAPLAVALGRCMQQAAASAVEDSEKRRELLAIAQELVKLRRGDHEQARVTLERERWVAEQEEVDVKKQSNKTLAPFWTLLLARGISDLYKPDLEKPGAQIPGELQAFMAQMGNGKPARNGSIGFNWPNIPDPDQAKSK